LPTLKIQTNVEVPIGRRKVVLEAASSTVAEQLGKPESYVMVLLETNSDMIFAASGAPMAYLELKSLGLPEERTPDLSAALCGFMERHFGVPPARVYIEFSSPPRHLFGWNGRTF
jgi:phenylpyruvate tautomerase PptA (4-oxalocrotonate tautomerase family)